MKFPVDKLIFIIFLFFILHTHTHTHTHTKDILLKYLKVYKRQFICFSSIEKRCVENCTSSSIRIKISLN